MFKEYRIGNIDYCNYKIVCTRCDGFGEINYTTFGNIKMVTPCFSCMGRGIECIDWIQKIKLLYED